MTITAAVIGCGNISQYHFSGLEKCGAKVKWVCDLSEEAAQPYKEKFGAQYTADFMETINDPEVDVVFVILISSLHKKICTAAIEAGKAIICEKTLAENSDDAAEITKLAREHGTLFYTSYMKRFFPAARKAKELLPELGQIIVSYVRVFQSWGKLWSEPPTSGFAWTPPGGVSVIKQNYGGGILTCGGSHMLDMTLYLLMQGMAVIDPTFKPESGLTSPRLGLVSVNADPLISSVITQLLDSTDIPVEGVLLPSFSDAFVAGMALINAETWAACGHLLETGKVGDDVAQRLQNAAATTKEQLNSAEWLREQFTQEVDEALKRVTALVLPSLPSFPMSLAEAKEGKTDLSISALVRPFNLSGHPALTIPLETTDKRPVGLQLVGRKGEDEVLCQLACLLSEFISNPRNKGGES